MSQSKRELHLEGLRGLAALAVVLFHFLDAFFPRALAGADRTAGVVHTGYEHLWYGQPWAVFTSGVFAVAIFFVLSGYVLTILFFRVQQTDVLRKMALKRYLRLAIPAAVSVLLVYVFLKLQLLQVAKFSAVVQNPDLGAIWSFPPHALDALYQATWGAYFSNSSTYNPVLWTMTYEFLGSMLLLGYLAIVGRLTARWLGYVLLMVFLAHTYFFGFILGMVLADVTANKPNVAAFFSRFWVLLLPMALLGLFLGGYPYGAPGHWYSWLTPRIGDFFANRNFWLTIGALLLTASINWSRLGRRALSIPPLVKLGSYTYSIYLTHSIFTFTLLPVIFIGLRGLGVGYATAALSAIALCLPVVIVTGRYFTRYVDAPAIRISRAFAQYAMSNRPANLGDALRRIPTPAAWWRSVRPGASQPAVGLSPSQPSEIVK